MPKRSRTEDASESAYRTVQAIIERHEGTIAAGNVPSGGAVKLTPAAPYVLLSFTDLKCLRSINPPDSGKGWTGEKEVSIFFLALDAKRQRLAWIWLRHQLRSVRKRPALAWTGARGAAVAVRICA